MCNLPRRRRRWRRALLSWARKAAQQLKDTRLLERAQIVYQVSRGLGAEQTSQLLGCSRSHVYRTVDRFSKQGRGGLFDRRLGPHARLADADYTQVIKQLLEQSPQDYGYMRPTWTRELFILVAQQQTGVRVSLSVMSRILRRLRARRGRPKPVVQCRLSERQKRRRLRKIRDLVSHHGPREVVVYEDEVDIHLNPKIGLDWMAYGKQKLVVTPGQNHKAYLAGCLDADSGNILWVGGTRKDSQLFIQMLERLVEHYPQKTCIHVVLDNYGIHSSEQTCGALRRLPTIRLHFLPPYCPDENRIERLWQDLHANVTRNHKHTTLDSLCTDVARWLDLASPWPNTMRPHDQKHLPRQTLDSTEYALAA